MDVQLFQTLLLKMLSFLYCIVFAPLSKISFVYRPHMYVGLFLGSLLHSTDLFVYSVLISVALQQVLKLSCVCPLTLFFFFNAGCSSSVLAILGLLPLCINIRITLLI